MKTIGNVIKLPEGVIAYHGTAAPSELVLANFNPSARTYEKQLRKLKKAVQDAGCNVLNPLHVYAGPAAGVNDSNTGRLLDGHRRRTVAIELNIPSVPVIVYYGDFELVKKYFVILNDSQLKLNKQQQMEVRYNGGPTFPDIEDKYDELQDLLSDFEFEQLIERKLAPTTLLGLARSICKYANLKAEQAAYKPFLRKSIVWMMTNNQQQQPKQFMRQFSIVRGTKTEWHVRKLVAAVNEDKPLEW